MPRKQRSELKALDGDLKSHYTSHAFDVFCIKDYIGTKWEVFR